jgi:hypothetical protein
MTLLREKRAPNPETWDILYQYLPGIFLIDTRISILANWRRFTLHRLIAPWLDCGLYEQTRTDARWENQTGLGEEKKTNRRAYLRDSCLPEIELSLLIYPSSPLPPSPLDLRHRCLHRTSNLRPAFIDRRPDRRPYIELDLYPYPD